jgi:hypothetical protein
MVGLKGRAPEFVEFATLRKEVVIRDGEPLLLDPLGMRLAPDWRILSAPGWVE